MSKSALDHRPPPYSPILHMLAVFHIRNNVPCWQIFNRYTFISVIFPIFPRITLNERDEWDFLFIVMLFIVHVQLSFFFQWSSWLFYTVLFRSECLSFFKSSKNVTANSLTKSIVTINRKIIICSSLFAVLCVLLENRYILLIYKQRTCTSTKCPETTREWWTIIGTGVGSDLCEKTFAQHIYIYICSLSSLAYLLSMNFSRHHNTALFISAMYNSITILYNRCIQQLYQSISFEIDVYLEVSTQKLLSLNRFIFFLRYGLAIRIFDLWWN